MGTRPQVNRYLEIESELANVASFRRLPESARRGLLCELLERFNVETAWKEQCLEIKHREVRRLTEAELKRILAVVRWTALRAYVKSDKFQKPYRGWNSLQWNAVLGWIPRKR